jgi:hypothetical protein
MGRNNVDDALLRLDKLTQEECGVKVTKSLAEAINEDVKATKALTKDIDANVTKVTQILTEEVHESIKVVERDARRVADNVRDNRHRA